jgi:hypothetical protein
VPVLFKMNPTLTTPPYLRSLLILSANLRLGLRSGCHRSGFPKIIVNTFLCHIIRANALPIILLYLKSTSYGASDSYLRLRYKNFAWGTRSRENSHFVLFDQGRGTKLQNCTELHLMLQVLLFL